MSKINLILGKIKKANEENNTILSSQRIELGKGKNLLDEAEQYSNDLEFFWNQFEKVETQVSDAIRVIKKNTGLLNQLKEEMGNQADDAKSNYQEAAKLASKMDAIAQEMSANDLDANPVMEEVKLLDKAVKISKETADYGSQAVAAVNNLLSKIK